MDFLSLGSQEKDAYRESLTYTSGFEFQDNSGNC